MGLIKRQQKFKNKVRVESMLQSLRGQTTWSFDLIDISPNFSTKLPRPEIERNLHKSHI